MDIKESFTEIERAVGHLSPVQKFLLGTDGSVTHLLEAITGHPVAVATLLQKVVPADAAAAERLGIRAGESVNHRVVELKNADTGEILMYAVSDTPLSRLSPEFKDDLMRADIPIGKIISRHRIEARREILSAKVTPAGDATAPLFSIGRDEPLLSRDYRIIHKGDPLIYITEQFPYNRFLDERRVVVETGSRIHLGLIDLHGGSGRVDGGIGIALSDPRVLLEARQSAGVDVTGCDEATTRLVKEIAARTLAGIRAGAGVSVTLRSSYQSHAGLGSGSQLAIATAKAICELYGRSLTVRELARLTGRGGTSGIGTAAFETGGFIIDGGHRFGPDGEKKQFAPSSASKGVRPAHVTVRHDFPPDWKVVLAIPDITKGASGGREADIFLKYCPVPLDEVRALCHEVLVRMLPGIVEHDLDLFGSSVNAIQSLGFKKVEHSLQPKEMGGLLDAMRSAGAAGAGMSSFGPTLFAFCDTGVSGVESAARSFMDGWCGGTTLVTAAKNSGAAIRVA
ncbi:MAG: Beta-ribofuranosylaminobenzene 5'-phosphate synthase [Methanoregula sp. PtaU1.Bin051]|nr:MAG: Beta-ribofuranosylaminobenzene 5'-phosphate synthase [Methanoregula sp. PtaU1.Bin051]